MHTGKTYGESRLPFLSLLSFKTQPPLQRQNDCFNVEQLMLHRTRGACSAQTGWMHRQEPLSHSPLGPRESQVAPSDTWIVPFGPFRPVWPKIVVEKEKEKHHWQFGEFNCNLCAHHDIISDEDRMRHISLVPRLQPSANCG